MTERRSKEKEDEILKRAMMLELIRVQRLEEERNEEYRREQEQEQRVLAEGAKRLDEISFKRMEVEKERLENLEMAEMETLSMRALEFEKITNLLLDIEEANCILCETCCKRRLTKKKRKRKKKLLCHPHDPVLIEEANVEDEFSDVRMNSQYNFSEQELFDKQQQIDSMGNYWLTETHSFIAECKGKELLHGIVAPAREDLLRVLGVELQTLSQNILTTAVDVDRETNEKQLQLPFGDRHETPMDDLQLRGEEVDEPLLQALNCWQKWVKSTGLTARGDRIKSEISVTANSPIVSKGEINSMIPGLGLCSLADEEINQLLSFGLRPLKLSEPDISYQEISLTVESLTDCAFLRTFTQLQRLHLNVNKLRTLVGLEHMMSLEELSIKDNALCALNNIGKLTSLRSLSVDDNSLNAQGLAALSDLRNLHTLSANTNKLHTFPYLAGCHGLQRLHLYHNSISLISTSSLTPLCSLMHLDLGRNKLEIISGAALSQCPLLQTLVLSQNLLTSPPSPLYLPNLRTMWLSGNKLHDLQSWLPYKDPREMKDPGSDSTCRNSDGLIWPLFIPMIEKLHFSDNLLTKIDAGAVCNMPLLVDLDISFNSVQTTLGLDGLRFLSKLTSLQIHDNPIYSTSGGSGAERNELTCWLVHECPSLRVVSGNVLQKVDHPTPPRVSVAEFGNVGASAPPTAFGTNNSSSAAPDPVKIDSPVSSARYREVLLADFRKTGKWSAAASLDLSFHYQSRIKEVLAPTIVYTGRDGLTLSKLSNISLLSKKFVQTLLVLNYDQNVLKAREKIENIRAKYPANVLINLADKVELGVEQKKRFYWETALVQQLDDHTRRLLAWSGNSITTCDLPIVMMAKFQTPIEDEEVGVVIDQIRDICNTFDIPHPEVIHSAAAERMHNVTSLPTASSVPVDSSDYLYLPTTVPSGISRLQAVWRSRKIRARVRSVLLASRYQDDELDELFGGVGFDLDEALTLQGYEEYLAPVVLEKGWEGGQNSIFTNNSDNGWVDGEMGRGSHSKVGTYHQYESRMDDNEDGSFATQGVSVVYGDHKRKKSNQRVEAASFYRTHDSDNGQRTYNVAANLLSCQTESNDSLSRPSSSRTETSSLSGASLQTRADPDSYRSMLSIRTRGCSSDIADSEATKINEWGIKDPKVLQAMMKRNKRMR